MSKKQLVWMLACLWLAVLLVAATAAPWWGNPLELDLRARLMSPQTAHFFGTDELGRDLFVRLAHAARFSLSIAAGATALAVFCGFVLGTLAGWLGGPTDRWILGLINVCWAVPFVIFAVLYLTIVGVHAMSLIQVIGIISFASSARVYRAETIRLRKSEFITAARACGFSTLEILFTHIRPNLWPTTVALVSFGLAESVTLESGLAFLGLSLPPPSPTWGGLMADGLAHFATAWWVAGIPALTITATLASFRIIADRMERLDLKS